MNRIPKVIRTFFSMMFVIVITQIFVRMINDEPAVTINAKYVFGLFVGTAVGTTVFMLLSKEWKPRSATSDGK
jgi:hypothetical protein